MLGFNTVRILFCSEMFIQSQPMPGSVDFNLNPDLANLTPLQCLDQIVKYCGAIGLRIILSRESSKADAGYNELLWFIPGDPYYTQSQFVTDLKMLAKRYAGTMNNFNETFFY